MGEVKSYIQYRPDSDLLLLRQLDARRRVDGRVLDIQRREGVRASWSSTGTLSTGLSLGRGRRSPGSCHVSAV